MAHALAELFRRNHSIVQIISRNKKTGLALAKKLKATYSSSLKDISSTADFYFLAVPDDSIQKISKSLTKFKGIVVHHSGAKPMNEIKSNQQAVIYPLVSLQQDSILNKKSTLIFVQAKHASHLVLIDELFKGLLPQIHVTDNHSRQKMHLAAVIANNFTNHLLLKADEMTGGNPLIRQLLIHLAQQSVDNLKKGENKKRQTGPARRNDRQTMASHLKLIKKNKKLTKIYLSLSQSIQHTYE